MCLEIYGSVGTVWGHRAIERLALMITVAGHSMVSVGANTPIIESWVTRLRPLCYITAHSRLTGVRGPAYGSGFPASNTGTLALYEIRATFLRQLVHTRYLQFEQREATNLFNLHISQSVILESPGT